jgi:nucleotide-binding universal stress UspA family protein
MRVIVAVDGSDAAEEVVSKVAPWVSGVEAEVELLTIIDASEIHGALSRRPDYETMQWGGEIDTISDSGVQFPAAPPPKVWEFSSQALEEVRAERIDFLDELGARYLAATSWQARVENSEHAAEGILRRAAEVGADVIAVGTHGRTALQRLLFGSIAEAVVRNAAVPVFIVPASHGNRAALENEAEVSA